MLEKISYNLGIATISRGIVGIIGLVVIGFLTRYLGPVGYGHYSSVFAYLYVFSSLADLGLYTVLVREVSKAGVDENAITSKIFTLRLLSVIVTMVAAGLMVLAINYPIAVKTGIWVALLSGAFSSLAQVLTGVFQKHLKLYYVSIADVVSRIIQLVLLIVAIHLKTSLLLFVWIVVVTEMAHFLITFLFSRSLVKIKMDIDWPYWLVTLKTAIPIAVSLIFVLIYFKLDTVLLSVMRPAYDVGVYSVAYKVLEVVIFLPALYVGLVMPLLSRHASENKNEFRKTYVTAFNVISIFGVFTASYIFMLSRDIVGVLGGAGFLQAVPVLKILSFAILLIFFGNLAGNAIVALNLQKKGLWVYLSGAVVNLGLNAVLISKYSYYATAWTTVLTELLITVSLFILIKRLANVTPHTGVLVKSIFSALIVCGLMALFINKFAIATLLSFLYFPILFGLGGFTWGDIREIIAFKKTPSLSEDAGS